MLTAKPNKFQLQNQMPIQGWRKELLNLRHQWTVYSANCSIFWNHPFEFVIWCLCFFPLLCYTLPCSFHTQSFWKIVSCRPSHDMMTFLAPRPLNRFQSYNDAKYPSGTTTSGVHGDLTNAVSGGHNLHPESEQPTHVAELRLYCMWLHQQQILQNPRVHVEVWLKNCDFFSIYDRLDFQGTHSS